MKELFTNFPRIPFFCRLIKSDLRDKKQGYEFANWLLRHLQLFNLDLLYMKLIKNKCSCWWWQRKSRKKVFRYLFWALNLGSFFRKLNFLLQLAQNPPEMFLTRKKKLVDIFFQTFSFHLIPICLYLAIFFHCVN